MCCTEESAWTDGRTCSNCWLVVADSVGGVGPVCVCVVSGRVYVCVGKESVCLKSVLSAVWITQGCRSSPTHAQLWMPLCSLKHIIGQTAILLPHYRGHGSVAAETAKHAFFICRAILTARVCLPLTDWVSLQYKWSHSSLVCLTYQAILSIVCNHLCNTERW